LLKRYTYRFDTFSSYIEQSTGLKIGPGGKIIGLNRHSFLHENFGAGARRFYPFGCLLVLPTELPPHPFEELPEDPEWDVNWEPDMLYF
jgi:hypothetical protein